MDKIMKIEDMMPLINTAIESGGEFRLITAGVSMKPLLRDRKDTVVLVKANKPLKKYDIPLYKRKEGKYVLHRIVKIKDGKYVMCGDHQYVYEYGITDDDICAVVSAIIRNDKFISCKSFKYKLYVFLHMHLRPIRLFFLKCKYFCQKYLFCKKVNK